MRALLHSCNSVVLVSSLVIPAEDGERRSHAAQVLGFSRRCPPRAGRKKWCHNLRGNHNHQKTAEALQGLDWIQVNESIKSLQYIIWIILVYLEKSQGCQSQTDTGYSLGPWVPPCDRGSLPSMSNFPFRLDVSDRWRLYQIWWGWWAKGAGNFQFAWIFWRYGPSPGCWRYKSRLSMFEQMQTRPCRWSVFVDGRKLWKLFITNYPLWIVNLSRLFF